MIRYWTLLLVDDDSLISSSLKMMLPSHWRMIAVKSLEQIPQDGVFHAAFVDLHLSADLKKAEGPEAITKVIQNFPRCEVVAISGDLSMALMESCLSAGAKKFIAKPLHLDEVKSAIEKIEALWNLREIEQRQQNHLQQWIGQSKQSESLREQLAQLRGEKGPILIEGETGTGKEVVSQLLHQQEPDRPFVPVNISSIPEALFESEIFGHVKGAFTGADQNKMGLAEAAHGGDLFLDEIEALPINQQVKLLRFLESGEIRRVGSKETIHVQVRVIAASNQKLSVLVKEGKFREDLLYRLTSQKIDLPALRERPDDIASLTEHFFNKLKPRVNKTLSSDALTLLKAYSWPGNVRELKRICEQLALVSPLPIVRAVDVSKILSATSNSADSDLSLINNLPDIDGSKSLDVYLSEYEKLIIQKALEQSKSIESAIELLKVSRSSLYKKIKDFGLEVPT